MKARIPLVGQPNQRNLDSLQALIEGKDQRYQNGLIVPIHNPIAGTVKNYFEKRPGLEAVLCDGEPTAEGCLGQTLFYSRTTGKKIAVFCDNNVYVDCTVLPSELAPVNDNPGYFLALTNANGGTSRGAISLDDGVTWSSITLSDTSVGWQPGAAWLGNNKWAAVANSTTKGALSIDGGNTFGAVTFPTAPNVYLNIQFGGAGGGYVLASSGSVGISKSIMAKSVDRGVNYTSHPVAAFSSLGCLFWCKEPGLWVAAGGLSDPGLRVLTSPDGELWTSRTADNKVWKAGVWTGEAAIIVANAGVIGGDRHFTRSTDCVTWDAANTDAGGSGIAFDGTNLVAIDGIRCWHSTDHGVTWTNVTVGSNANRNYIAIAYNGNVFCALSFNDGVGLTATSVTGESGTWTERANLPAAGGWSNIRAAFNRAGYL